jgi:hypothetical protein
VDLSLSHRDIRINGDYGTRSTAKSNYDFTQIKLEAIISIARLPSAVLLYVTRCKFCQQPLQKGSISLCMGSW